MKVLLAVQAAIFVLTIAAVFLLYTWENEARARHAELTERLHAIGTAPAELAAQLQQARTEAAYISNFLADFHFGDGVGDALNLIIAATPENSVLLNVRYDHGEFHIRGHSHSHNTSEAHHTNLSTHFTYVHLVSIIRTDTGYTVEFRVRM